MLTRSILLAVCLFFFVVSSLIIGGQGHVQALSDIGAGNKAWFSIASSVPANSYEVAIQAQSSTWGWRTVFVRDHNTARNNHPFDFYDIGKNQFRIILTKVNGSYVNRQCGAVIDWRFISNGMVQRACQ
jgi:hypothetical protein